MVGYSVRWASVQRIVELAAAHPDLDPDDVTISPGWVGDDAGPERIYLGDLDSAEPMNVPVTRGPNERLTYDDMFVMTWGIEVAPIGRNLAEVMARCETLLNALIEVVAVNAQLAGLDGVISARISDQKGPLAPEFPGVGHLAVAQLTLTVHSRID